MKRLGKRTITFERPPSILGHAAVGGKKEAEGPLSAYFAQIFSDERLYTDSFEKAEAQLQKESVSLAIDKSGTSASDMDMIFAGDLLDQCIASSYGLMDYEIPFIGQYGACSTMAQTLMMASIAVDCGAARKAVAVTSSHFCSAERQFRTPLEYGSQRTPTAQWTATASGSAVVGTGGELEILSAIPGKIIDLGVKDPANMGAAMAPAAADTILSFLKDTSTSPEDYDCIYTGDLGMVGSQLLYDLLLENGINLEKKHNDCGLMLYDLKGQDVHAGASGCGCSASVLCGYILKKMEEGELSNIIFAATGALMSPTSQQQGCSIPGICHALNIKRK